MSRATRLLFPALRWNADTGFAHERDNIEQALQLGVGGFIIFGGEAEAVADLIASIQARSGTPLLFASDLERGAGQQFPQATQLPPLAALGALDDLAVTRRAGALTAREALALGIGWIFAPVADIDLEPRNPIVGTRSFGTEPGRVAAHVAAWIEGARAQGALCCAKHFPGHGRTHEDSHETLPRVQADRAELEVDLTPFRAAIAAGVDAVMTAHVAYDALDGGSAGTLSPAVVTGLLRGELRFDGMVATDALNMKGMQQAGQGSEAAGAVQALRAGCDALLYPDNLPAVAAALEDAVRAEPELATQALRRVHTAAQHVHTRGAASWGTQRDRAWADDVAERSLMATRGAPRVADTVELLTIDDDLGGPFAPPARTAFGATLRAAGRTVRAVEEARADSALVIAVYADIRAWKGAPGLSARAAEALRSALYENENACIAFFGHPRLTENLPGRHILAAWGGEAIMQRAAARWLARTR